MSAGLLRKFWGDKPAHWQLILTAGVVSLLMALPAAYIIKRALGAKIGVWPKLWTTQIPSLLGSTISLTVAVTIATILISVPAAWLVCRTDLPGRQMWQWLLSLPLAIPPYIGSLAYITIFGPLGTAHRFIADLLGVSPYSLSFPSIYTFPGVLIIMALFIYPYVFLITSAALKRQNQSLIDAARASGLSMVKVFFRVTLPLLRPSIAAGSLLVALYVLSDFGAISLLRYPTFTSAIYQQLIGKYDREAAAALSMVLMVLTIGVIWLESRSRQRTKYFQTTSSYRPAEIIELGRWRWPALTYIFLLLLFALVVPIGLLVSWSVIGIGEGALNSDFWSYTLNSIASSGLAATAAVILALPVVYLFTRHNSIFSKVIFRLSYSGYALPGVLVGLGMVFFFNSAVPWLYGTVPVLILGYIVRFLPQCLQAEESALASISPNLEEAATSFGYNTFTVLRRVTIPLLLPAMAAGWSLVFISSMKELAATLLLRPAGFDTLAIRVWLEAGDGFYALAAPAALLLVMASAIPLTIITRRTQIGRPEESIDESDITA